MADRQLTEEEFQLVLEKKGSEASALEYIGSRNLSPPPQSVGREPPKPQNPKFVDN